jgi:hypothetical protein
MVYKVVSVFKRPNTEVKFHTEEFIGKTADSWKAIQVKYMMAVRRSINIDDAFTLRIENIWDSEEQYEEYRAEPAVVAHQARVDAYNESTGIIVEPKICTVED